MNGKVKKSKSVQQHTQKYFYGIKMGAYPKRKDLAHSIVYYLSHLSVSTSQIFCTA
jgi:hypothetical protein